MPFEGNPFVELPKQTRVEMPAVRSEYRNAEANFEKYCLYGKDRKLPSTIAARAEKIKQEHPEAEFGSLDFYVGAAWHEMANTYRSAFFTSLKQFAEQKGIPVEKCTQQDVDTCFDTFSDREVLTQMENYAARAYKQATPYFWKTKWQDREDAAVLQHDLQDRMALEHLRGSERDARRRAGLKGFESLIDHLPACGRKSELQFMYLVRALSLEHGVGHLVGIEHGLPREDLADQKVDVRLRLGTRLIPLQMKTEDMRDAYRSEHYESVRNKAEAAIKDQETVLLRLDTPTIDAAYRLYGREGTKAEKIQGTRAKNQLLAWLSEVVPEDAKAGLGLLGYVSEKKKAAESSGVYFTEKLILNVANVPFLVDLGLLPRGVMDAVAIKHAKSMLVAERELLREIFQTPEALTAKKPELVAQMRIELEKRLTNKHAA